MMDSIRKILKEETDRRDKLKDLMKRQLTAGGTFNLGKVIKTFGANNPIMKETVIEWANEGLQRMKSITATSEEEATFIKMFDGIYADFWFDGSLYSLFFFKDNPTKPEIWFELENSRFWCDVDRVWSVFEDGYYMLYTDIQDLMRPTLEAAFNLRGVRPDLTFELRLFNWKRLSI